MFGFGIGLFGTTLCPILCPACDRSYRTCDAQHVIGAISRVLLARAGSVLIYGSIATESDVEGQMSLEQLRGLGLVRECIAPGHLPFGRHA